MHDEQPQDRRPLGEYARNVFSQFGEDGIVDEILARIGGVSNLDGWCVEFGAWDGEFLSNTCHLIRDKGYRAVLIEGDPRKCKQLERNHPSPDVVKVCRFVQLSGDSTLDRILQDTPIPDEFDFLSIDIDGCDYFIWESLRRYTPKVICVEFNPTMPNAVDYVQPPDFARKIGSSASALVRLAADKGYALVAVTHCNTIFVRNRYAEAVLGSPEALPLESLRDDSEHRRYVFSGYDGTIITSGPVSLPWLGMNVPLGGLQYVPRLLRRFPSDYGLMGKLGLALFLGLKSPDILFSKIGGFIRRRRGGLD